MWYAAPWLCRLGVEARESGLRASFSEGAPWEEQGACLDEHVSDGLSRVLSTPMFSCRFPANGRHDMTSVEITYQKCEISEIVRIV